MLFAADANYIAEPDASIRVVSQRQNAAYGNDRPPRTDFGSRVSTKKPWRLESMTGELAIR